MCLRITVQLSEVDAPQAVEICRAVGLHPSASEAWCYGAARRNSGVIWIPGPEGGCGCSFLTGGAVRRGPVWKMEAAARPGLAGTLRTIRQRTSQGFTFDAVWIGEPPTKDLHITIDELAGLVEQSKLRRDTRYLVD